MTASLMRTISFPLNANKSDLFFYKLSGETRTLTGSDFDGDGRNDLIVKSASAPDTVYLISAADINDVDDDDGEADHVVDFDQASSLGNSWKFMGVQGTNHLSSAGDVDFDEEDDVVVAGSQDTFVVPMSSMQAADAADGQTDRSITIGRGLEGSTVGAWRLTATDLERGVYSLADTNADGHKELLIGAPMIATTDVPVTGSSTAYVASGADWAAADDLDDSDDGVIDLDQWIARANTFKLTSQSGAGSGASIARAGDFDGDGYEDLMVSVPGSSVGGVLRAQTVYLLSGMKLDSFDTTDGTTDGKISLNQAHGEGFWQLNGGNFEPERALSTAGRCGWRWHVGPDRCRERRCSPHRRRGYGRCRCRRRHHRSGHPSRQRFGATRLFSIYGWRFAFIGITGNGCWGHRSGFQG